MHRTGWPRGQPWTDDEQAKACAGGGSMSILIGKDTKVMTQGITGKTGAFHTRLCRDYA